MRRGLYLLVALLFAFNGAFSQGFGIPSKKGGIGFGNLPKFTGIRFNVKDKNVEKLTGINFTVWFSKHDADQSGVMNGLSIGLPMAMGHQDQNGISIGLLGVGATRNLNGINIGGLATGSGNSINGFNFGGLAIGSGQDIRGVNIGGLAAGAGGSVVGFNLAAMGVGCGENLSGFSFGGLGVGSGQNVSGITIGGLGVGAGESMTGFQFGGLGVGAGEKITGVTIAGLGIGAGDEVRGIMGSLGAIGSPRVTGLAVASAVGGMNVRGIIIAPLWFRVGAGKRDPDYDKGTMRGISVSAYNRIIGEQRGVAFGIVNYTRKIKGVQFGLINIVRENPKGLRVLPFFNTRFGKGE